MPKSEAGEGGKSPHTQGAEEETSTRSSRDKALVLLR